MATKTESKAETLHDLFVMKLQMLIDVEQQIIKALPKMQQMATNEALRDALENHLEETKSQAGRLEEVMGHLDMETDEKPDQILRTIISEGEQMIAMAGNDAVRDVALIAAAQTVEMYEVGAYSTALAWAEEMGHKEIMDLLQESLDEEEACNEKLAKLAKGGINEAANEGEEA